MTISSILFDYGGTLDADGLHWLDRFYAIYDRIGLGQVSKERIKEAFYWADRAAERDDAMRHAGLWEMMHRHVRWQFEKLGLEAPAQQAEAVRAFAGRAEAMLARNLGVLHALRVSGLRLGVVSNFYGNVEVLCREAGYGSLLDVVVDSALAGVSKPDPEIFLLAARRLGAIPSDVLVVGDSFERDVVPARAAGMQAVWLTGPRARPFPDPSHRVPTLRTLEELPGLLRACSRAGSTDDIAKASP